MPAAPWEKVEDILGYIQTRAMAKHEPGAVAGRRCIKASLSPLPLLLPSLVWAEDGSWQVLWCRWHRTSCG